MTNPTGPQHPLSVSPSPNSGRGLGGGVERPPSAESLRLFIAVELTQAWREALARTQAELKRCLADGDNLRWVKPDGIHLTLKFLGQVPAERRNELEAVLSATIAEAPRQILQLGRPGYFARRSRLTVLWSGVEGDLAALSILTKQIDEACASLGFEPEVRPFAPHLTLARVPATVSLFTATADRVLATVAISDAPPLTVRHVSLMRSLLGPGGARYERLSSFPSTVGT